MQLLAATVALLGLLALSARAANFGSCSSVHYCGFMCCEDGETCANGSFCVAHDFISTALSNPQAASVFPSLANPSFRSSVLAAVSTGNPSAVQSVYNRFAQVLTDAPTPSPLGTTVPSGAAIPSELVPSRASPSGKTVSPTSRPRSSSAVPSKTSGTSTPAVTTAPATKPSAGAAGRNGAAAGLAAVAAVAAAVLEL